MKLPSSFLNKTDDVTIDLKNSNQYRVVEISYGCYQPRGVLHEEVLLSILKVKCASFHSSWDT